MPERTGHNHHATAPALEAIGLRKSFSDTAPAIGDGALLAAAWCLGLAMIGYRSMRLQNRDPDR